MLNRAKEIYNYLMDEESRDVFINKMMYTVSGDYSFINTIVDKYASKNDRVCNPEFEKKLNNSISDKNIPVIIYGAGIVGKLIYTMVPKERMLCFCDMNKDLEGREIDGIKIVSPEEIYKEKKDAYIILAIWQQYMPEVKMNFKNAGYDIDSLIEGTEFFLMKGIANDMYFDEDIVKLSKDEIFIDCGSYDLSTSEDLISRRNDIKKIYAFEPDPANYNICLERIKNFPCEVELFCSGLWNEDKTLSFHSFSGTGSKIVENGNSKIEVRTIDSILKGGVATFIKMDIEGAELEALEGAKNTIKKYKPKLAISVYHKPNDIIEILSYIKSIMPEYKFYLRHYTNTEVDTVLYAVIN